MRCARLERENTPQRMFRDQKIADGQCHLILWDHTGVLKAVFRMETALDKAIMTLEILRGDQHTLAYFQTKREVGGIVKLVAHVAAKVGDMPAHSQRRQRTQDAAGIQLPGMVGII